MSLFLELLPTVVKNLENHLEVLRIKKFIYCLCNQKWENDPDIFNQYSLEILLTELIKVQPNIKRLSIAMYELVKSLNRQQLYAGIAKVILEQLAPIYHADRDDVENSQIQQLLTEELARQNLQPNICINLMESLVKDAIFQEFKKLPLRVSKSLNSEEVAAYALNRLPPLYIYSEEGKLYQLQKAEKMKEEINLTVIHSIGAIMRDPIRKYTPMKVNSGDSFAEVHFILNSLEKFTKKRGEIHENSKFNDLSKAVISIVNDHENSFIELENFLKINNLSQEKITVKNLAFIIKKVIRRLLKNESQQTQLSPSKSIITERVIENGTEIRQFLNEENESDDNPSTSIRDWYNY